MKKQAPEKVVYKIDAYPIINNITTSKLCATQTLPNKNVAIQTISIDEAEKLREEDGWTKFLGSKAKLIQKRYGVVAFAIIMAKIDFKKIEETKRKHVTQDASISMSM